MKKTFFLDYSDHLRPKSLISLTCDQWKRQTEQLWGYSILTVQAMQSIASEQVGGSEKVQYTLITHWSVKHQVYALSIRDELACAVATCAHAFVWLHLTHN